VAFFLYAPKNADVGNLPIRDREAAEKTRRSGRKAERIGETRALTVIRTRWSVHFPNALLRKLHFLTISLRFPHIISA